MDGFLCHLAVGDISGNEIAVKYLKHEDRVMISREELIAAQMREFPDSRIISIAEVLNGWANSVPEEAKTEPDALFKLGYNLDSEAEQFRMMVDWNQRQQILTLEHQKMILMSVAHAFYHHPVVFYECGKREDGTYQYRGARYGVAGHEYISGFGSS